MFVHLEHHLLPVLAKGFSDLVLEEILCPVAKRVGSHLLLFFHPVDWVKVQKVHLYPVSVGDFTWKNEHQTFVSLRLFERDSDPD